MWGATHTAVGSWIYDSVHKERWWFQVVFIIVGGFVTHWLLDSTGVYHHFTWRNIWDFLIIVGQLAATSFLLAYCGLRQVAIGAVAWLIWDTEWLFRTFGVVGENGFFHYYVVSTSWDWGRSEMKLPWTFLLETFLLTAVIFISRPEGNFSWNHWIKQKYGWIPLRDGVVRTVRWVRQTIRKLG